MYHLQDVSKFLRMAFIKMNWFIIKVCVAVRVYVLYSWSGLFSSLALHSHRIWLYHSEQIIIPGGNMATVIGFSQLISCFMLKVYPPSCLCLFLPFSVNACVIPSLFLLRPFSSSVSSVPAHCSLCPLLCPQFWIFLRFFPLWLFLLPAFCYLHFGFWTCHSTCLPLCLCLLLWWNVTHFWLNFYGDPPNGLFCSLTVFWGLPALIPNTMSCPFASLAVFVIPLSRFCPFSASTLVLQ